jgi:hypothetical protein
MKYWIIFLPFMVLCGSCKSNSQTKGFEEFQSEFSEQVIKKLADNSPFNFSEKVISNYKRYPYYEIFGNSGICAQFNLTDEKEKQIYAMLKNYELLNNELISYQDSSYIYIYDKQNLNIKIPELSEEFGELSTIKLKDKDIDIYLIEKGKLTNVFVNQNGKIYNYAIGAYFFKEHSAMIYWFLVY